MSKKLPVHLGRKEIDTLISSVKKDTHRLGLALMSYGGLRVSEMCSLKVSHINLSRGFMKITGKGNKVRFVPLTGKLQTMIEKYLSKFSNKLSQDSYLIGKTRNAWHYAVKRYSMKAFGRDDIHCHTLRHSFATMLYDDGVQLEKISLLLGHEKLDTTMIYSHIYMAQKRSAINTLDTKRTRFIKFISPIRKKHEISVKTYSELIGRETELGQLKDFLEKKSQ